MGPRVVVVAVVGVAVAVAVVVAVAPLDVDVDATVPMVATTRLRLVTRNPPGTLAAGSHTRSPRTRSDRSSRLCVCKGGEKCIFIIIIIIIKK